MNTETVEKNYTIRYVVKKLLKSVRNYKGLTFKAIVAIALEAICECFIPLVMIFLINGLSSLQDQLTANNNVMTDALQSQLINTVVMYAIILVVLTIFAFTFALMAARFSGKAAMGFAANLREDIFFKTQKFSFENIDRFSKASLVTRQTTDVNNIQLAYMMIIRVGILATVNFLFAFIASIVFGTSISWVYGITIPLIVIGVGVTIFFAARIFNNAFPKIDRMNKDIEENVSGIRTVKTYTREDFEKDKFKKDSEDIRNLMVKGEILAGLSNPIAQLCFQLSIVLFVFLGAKAMMNSTIQAGEFQALINYSIMVLQALMMFSMILVMVSMSIASSKRIVEILDEKPTIKNQEGGEKEIKDGSIVFDHVYFSYGDSDSTNYALEDINLSIASGETIGILGGTGSAKSTLVNVIPRFYDIQKGSLKVGGKEVKDYDVASLRDAVSMVLQKNILFSGTLRDNMKWGNPNATDEEIKKALDIAQASEFVDALPGKYDYKVEQGGTNFSGGQKQRLCIARALLKPSKVLIFDDSTSAVDTKTDAKIREGLRTSYAGVTKIIIAQRVSSVMDADRILVMDKGHIESIGTPEELYDKSPLFREICQMQGVNKEQLQR